MRWVDYLFAAALVLIATSVSAQSEYGKVETFQPGKKYNCVPTADRKGWDCQESGVAPKPSPTPTPPPPATTPTPAPATPATSERVEPVAPAPESPPPSNPMPAPSAKPTALPSYLRAQPAPMPRPAAPPPAPIAAAPKPEPAPVATPPPRETPPAPVVSTPAPPPAPEPATKPTAPTPPPVAASPSPTPASGSAHGNRDFLTLPASNYVIELAHGASRGDLAALRGSLRLPRGELYELHLSRDGGDWWVLVWASFDSMSAARAARSELPTDAAISVGWPRQIAPLQNEVRRRPE